MTTDDFRKFVEDKAKESVSKEPFDWQKEKKSYLSYLTALYDDVKKYLAEFISNGKIKVTESQIELDEESIGRYSANLLNIAIGNSVVQLVPIGTQLIGCKGRVDMKGRKGIIKIVLVDSRMKSLRDHIQITTHIGGQEPPKETTQNKSTDTIVWKWRLLTALPSGKYNELNEENFLEALMELAHD
jgi:hypothetical protein